jgi:hypothetical protein
LKTSWQRHVLARMRRSKSEPEDKTPWRPRNGILSVAVARHLVKADPGNPGAWINLAIQFGG